jgi:hypothetical protein
LHLPTKALSESTSTTTQLFKVKRESNKIVFRQVGLGPFVERRTRKKAKRYGGR